MKPIIRRRVNNTLSRLGLQGTVRWKDDAFFGSVRTDGGIELKDSEGKYSLVVYGSKESQTTRTLIDAFESGMAELEIKTVKILTDQPVSSSEKTSKSTVA